jgi:hypothetical protein
MQFSQVKRLGDFSQVKVSVLKTQQHVTAVALQPKVLVIGVSEQVAEV